MFLSRQATATPIKSVPEFTALITLLNSQFLSLFVKLNIGNVLCKSLNLRIQPRDVCDMFS